MSYLKNPNWKMLSFIASATFVFAATSAQSADRIWVEKDPSSPSMVNLPNFAPIVDEVDISIVHVASSTEPKPQQRRRRQMPQQQGPVDPFMNPEEFFERFFGQQMPEMPQEQRKALGSGFIISKDGYILTNNHVIEGFDKIEVGLLSKSNKIVHKGQTFTAKVVGRDPGTDIALLKINAGFPLSPVPLGNSAKMRKGDWVLAFGNPFGLDHSVSAGIISATGREISNDMSSRRFDDFIQTDAAINFGNSGGPLVNLRGEVIGINTAITAQGSGIGFAVPINIAKDVIPSLKETGSVARGYLGIQIQDVTDEMKDAFGLSEAKGVLVNDVVPNGPASKSSLKRGDIILKVNGEDVTDAKSLQQLVAKVRPGKTADLLVLRDKKQITVPVKVGNLDEGTKVRKPQKEEGEKSDKLGLIVGMNPEGNAVQIQDVDPGSPAAEVGVQPGDIVRDVIRNDQKYPIHSLSDYRKAISGVKSKQSIVLDLERSGPERGSKINLYLGFKVP